MLVMPGREVVPRQRALDSMDATSSTTPAGIAELDHARRSQRYPSSFSVAAPPSAISSTTSWNFLDLWTPAQSTSTDGRGQARLRVGAGTLSAATRRRAAARSVSQPRPHAATSVPCFPHRAEIGYEAAQVIELGFEGFNGLPGAGLKPPRSGRVGFQNASGACLAWSSEQNRAQAAPTGSRPLAAAPARRAGAHSMACSTARAPADA